MTNVSIPSSDDGQGGVSHYLSTMPLDVQGAAEAFTVCFGYRDICTDDFELRYPPGRTAPAFAFDARAGAWREWGERKGWRLRDSVLTEMTNIVAALCEVEAWRNNPGAEQERIDREVRKLRQKHFGQIVDRAIRLAAAMTSVKDWDPDPDLLGLPDGESLYMTPTNHKYPVHFDVQSPADYLTRCMGASPSEPTRLLTEFLGSLTGGDVEFLDGLGMWTAASMLEGNPYHKAHIMFGDGKTGKSTYLNLVRKAMGDYAGSGRASVFTSEKEQHPAELLPFVEKRLVVLPELPRGALRSDLLKTITGGDSISVRGMRQNPRTETPSATLMFSANELPSIRLVDNAIRRRLMIWPCDNVPATVDEFLGEKLASPQHLGGMVSFLINKLHKVLRLRGAGESIPIPAVVTAATDAYFNEADVIGQWLDYACVEEGETISTVLYGSFSAWCHGRNRRPVNETSFGLWMGRRYDRRRTNRGVFYPVRLAGVELV